MNVESTWRTAAAWLPRVQRGVERFVRPLPAVEASGPLRNRVPAPFCVSYGRVVFCLYYPEPRTVRDEKQLTD